MKKIKLATPEDVCNKANNMDTGLHEKEKSKFSFYALLTGLQEEFSWKFNFTWRW